MGGGGVNMELAGGKHSNLALKPGCGLIKKTQFSQNAKLHPYLCVHDDVYTSTDRQPLSLHRTHINAEWVTLNEWFCDLLIIVRGFMYH